MTLPGLPTLASLPLAGAAIGLFAGASTLRKRVAVILAIALLFTPFFVEGPPLLRAVCALMTAMVLFRTIDLSRERGARSARARAWHVVAVVDTRRVRRCAPAFSPGAALRVVGWTAPMALALWLASRIAPTLPAPIGPALHWFGGVVLAYCSFEALVAIVELVYLAFGVEVPRLHDAPIRARSIAEFWGRRWNRVVGTWLRTTVFLPTARRLGAQAGELAAFAASAILHAYVAWAALDAGQALSAGAFFAAQVPLLVAERRLGLARWPRSVAHAWTLTWLLLLSPLFVGPVLAVLDPLMMR